MIRSLLFNIIYFVGTPLWCFLMLPLLLAKTRYPMQKGIHIWIKFLIWSMQVIGGIRLEVRGQEHAPKDRAFLLISKHQSDGDPIVDYYLFPHVNALAKKELFSLPFIGSVLRKLEIVCIDRKSGNAHQEMADVTREIIDAKRPLIIYPEGTRVPVGERRRLKSGAYYIQKDNDIPVITVASNLGQFWPKRRFRRYTGTATFEIHPPLEKGLTKRAFMAEIERRVIQRSDEIMVEAFRQNPRLPDPKVSAPATEEINHESK